MSLAPPGVGDINDFNNMSANISIPQDFVNNSSGNLTSGSNEKDLCNSISIKSYFEKILELSRIGDEFPVNLNDVWPLAYSRKDVAVRSLVDDKNFIQDIDYQVFHQNVENLNGGRPTTVYMISVSCMEYLVARKVREVFNVYREVFHKAAKKVPSTYAEALRMYADEVEAKEKAEKEARLALEAKRISENIIKEQAPKVEFANTAIMANEKEDMLIRDVRRELETHGYDIAERSLREYLQDQNFFYKNKREWILTASAIDRGYGHYRYNADVLRNTVYMTRKGFERLLYNLKHNSRSRESFLSFGGKILND